MTPESAIKFLKALGSKDAKYDGGEWVKSGCILAPWTHMGGKDSNPSFGIHIKDARPHYNCFTCRSGDLTTLIQELEMFLGKGISGSKYDIKAARAILENEEFDIEPLPEFSEFGDQGVPFQEWPTYVVESFVSWEYSARAAKYLASRKMPMEMANKLGLRYDSNRDMIVFPYYNLYGKLAGARGRGVHFEGEAPLSGHKKHYDYTWNKVNNANLVWYNEQCLQEEPEYVLVLEGQFDCARALEVYPYALANLTAKPVMAKMKNLAYAGAVVVMTDNDETGDAAAKKYVDYLTSINKPVAMAQPPKEYDMEGKLIKLDPDAMGSEWIKAQLKELGIL